MSKDKCNHPAAALVPVFDFDPKTRKTYKTGTKCIDCKRFWKLIKRKQ